MALNEYIPTDWVNGTTPAINDTNLNHNEGGIKSVTDYVIAIGDVPPAGFDDTVKNTIKETGENKVVTLVYCTQATYDAILPVASTLYVIKG